jgi:hypothetical protein
VRGTLFVHEVLEVRPGSQLEFLAAAVEDRVPLLRDYGHQPTGIYEVLGNGHEVILVWATSVADQTRLRKARDATWGLSDEAEPDERFRTWERLAAGYVTGGITQIMTPLPRTVYGPPDWEEASLADWLGDETP